MFDVKNFIVMMKNHANEYGIDMDRCYLRISSKSRVAPVVSYGLEYDAMLDLFTIKLETNNVDKNIISAARFIDFLESNIDINESADAAISIKFFVPNHTAERYNAIDAITVSKNICSYSPDEKSSIINDIYTMDFIVKE